MFTQALHRYVVSISLRIDFSDVQLTIKCLSRNVTETVCSMFMKCRQDNMILLFSSFQTQLSSDIDDLEIVTNGIPVSAKYLNFYMKYVITCCNVDLNVKAHGE